jgi:hypothetical protein
MPSSKGRRDSMDDLCWMTTRYRRTDRNVVVRYYSSGYDCSQVFCIRPGQLEISR